MARIYVSSSWKNEYQPALVAGLRMRGHKVYDFRHPEGRNDQSVWKDVGINEESTPCEEFSKQHNCNIAQERFDKHFDAMNDADTCILLLPCGNSSHVEAGYMAGTGKRVFVYCPKESIKPELMYLTFDGFFYKLEDLYKALATPLPGVCRICGGTDENPCYNPDAGYCWWVDEEQTLCSHCADLAAEGEYSIKDDPETVHCVNDNGNGFK